MTRFIRNWGLRIRFKKRTDINLDNILLMYIYITFDDKEKQLLENKYTSIKARYHE